MEASGTTPTPEQPAEQPAPPPTVPASPIPDDARASEAMTGEQAEQLGQQFAQMRAEIAAYREELHKQQIPVAAIATAQETPEERRQARLALIAQHSYYCPACGNLGHYPQKCEGHPDHAGGHPALEMVPTDELSGDPNNYTKAPASTV